MKRRELLQRSAMVGAAIAFSPLRSFAHHLCSESPSQQANKDLLLSTALLIAANPHTRSASDFQSGIRKAWNIGGIYSLSSCYSNTAISSMKEHRKAIQNMVQRSDIRLLISLSGERERFYYSPFYNNSDKKFIEANLGENINTSQPIGSVGLRAWQSNYAAGRYAAQTIGKRAIVLSSAYDSAYDCYETLLAGYTTNGGIIEQTLIIGAASATETTHRHLDEHFVRACKSVNADCILMHLSGSAAVATISSLRKAGLHLPVVASYQSLPALVQTPGIHANNVLTAVPQHLHESTDAYIASAMRTSRYFAVIGYLAGLSSLRISATGKGDNYLFSAAQEKYNICRVGYGSRTPDVRILDTLGFDENTVAQQLRTVGHIPSGNTRSYLV